MARFSIHSPSGALLYTGTPTFTGSYMKPGMLEFREIASPVPIDFSAGCYVDYSRTQTRYKLYDVPQVKKQARPYSYGGAFLYQNVQFFDASKELEFCPFRDLVTGDNRIHFSTQPSISTFEGVDGLARRFQACLEDMYGTGSWVVRIATMAENPSMYDLMTEAREFTVSGINLLEALQKVYDIWPEVGWIYKVENEKNTIVIGGAGLNQNTGTYAYGKGYGLTSLTRTVANADDLANRIFAYGSQRNMLPNWYRRSEIKDYQSVDIQHLMIPVTPVSGISWYNGWGLTNNKRDAAKAYLEDASSISRRGLRPKTAYFDGSEDLPEIYPTIQGMTIGDVRSSSAPYQPHSGWSDSVRVDQVWSSGLVRDNGLAGESGTSRMMADFQEIPDNTTNFEISGDITSWSETVLTRTFNAMESGEADIEATVEYVGATITIPGATRVWMNYTIWAPTLGTFYAKDEIELSPVSSSNPDVFRVVGCDINVGEQSFTYNQQIQLRATISATFPALSPEEGSSTIPTRTIVWTRSGKTTIYMSRFRSKTFSIVVPQVGFDIGEQASLGEGKSISMRSGDCAGRTFVIKDCYPVEDSNGLDCWHLNCYRSEDESLSQWFPNSNYQIRRGDSYVLLDIAMPDSYISVAEKRLLLAARDLLLDTATERWQYVPEIDAKFMVENNRILRPAEYMALVDANIVEGTDENLRYFLTSDGEYFLTSNGERIVLDGTGYTTLGFIDTLVINEGEAAIPTYKVTLRDRKRKVFTEAASVSEISAHSVADYKEVKTTMVTPSSSFFELDSTNNSVKLKDQYAGLWANGFGSFGGKAGDGEGGDTPGGGGTSFEHIYTWSDLSGGMTQPTDDNKSVFNAAAVWNVYNLVTSNATEVNSLRYSVQSMQSDLNGFRTDVNGVIQAVDAIQDTVDEIDWFTPVTINGQLTLKLNTRYVGVWAEGFGSFGGASSTPGGGGGAQFSHVYGWRDLGDTTIPNDGDGVFDAYATNYFYGLFSQLESDVDAVTATVNTINGDYVTLSTTQEISGEKTFTNSYTYMNNLLATSLYLRQSASDSVLWKFGVGKYNNEPYFQIQDQLDTSEFFYFDDASFQGRGTAKNLGASSVPWNILYANSIRIGNAIIVYDTQYHMLRVYGTDGNDTVGLYTDGPLTGGGVPS